MLLVSIAVLASGGLLAIWVDLLAADMAPLHWTLGGVMIAIVSVSGAAGWLMRRNARALAVLTAGRPDIGALVRDKNAAETANAAKSRFLASVSHEIRSPLNSIYGYAQLLERGSERDPLEAARVIRRSAEHLTYLVEGLLDMSQVENGVMKLSRDVTPFAAFLDQIASMFRHSAAARGLTMRYDRPEILPDFVRMDPGRLRQVLINLLSNAIKFTPAGTVGLRVTYVGQTATFEISDTGPGIAASHQDTVFAPFDRGDPEANKLPGAGLGLAITQALVQILGGDLQMESKLGIGTTFRVTMMLGHVPGQIIQAAPVALIMGYDGPRRSILVADDDVHNLSLMRALLESLGFEVAVASRGDIAVEIGRRKTFDLAVLDISMPGLNGWETARQLRAGAEPGPRILMLSGNALERYADQDTAPLHDVFLLKPIDLDSLVGAIGKALDLTWNSIATAPPATLRDGTVEPPGALPDAALLHLRKIHDLLRIGHARGIESEIQALERAAPEAHALTSRMYGLLDRFDFPGLATVIEQHL